MDSSEGFIMMGETQAGGSPLQTQHRGTEITEVARTRPVGAALTLLLFAHGVLVARYLSPAQDPIMQNKANFPGRQTEAKCQWEKDLREEDVVAAAEKTKPIRLPGGRWKTQATKWRQTKPIAPTHGPQAQLTERNRTKQTQFLGAANRG
jgi:hypothetical protein